MEVTSGIVVYALLWWWIFLMSLPFGIQREENATFGHDIGAPKQPQLVKKLIASTLISAVLWFDIDWVISQEFLSFREMSKRL